MKLFHIYQGAPRRDNPNGVDQVLLQLLPALAKAGAEVHLVCVHETSPDPLPGVRVHTIAPAGKVFSLPDGLGALLQTHAPDALHLHSVYLPLNIAVGRFCRRRKIPYITTPHGGLSLEVMRRGFWKKLVYRWVHERPLQRQALFVQALGPVEAEAIRAYGVRRPIEVIPNGIELATMPPDLDPLWWRMRLPALESQAPLLFLGRLDPLQKGLDWLLEGMAQIKTTPPLVLAGPEFRGSRQRLSRIAAHLGISERIHFLEALTREDGWQALGGARALLCPSRWEGLPMTVLEACAVGTPCVVTPPADPMGRMAAEGAGIVIGPSGDGVAGGIRSVLDLSPDQREEMGGRARSLARSLNWDESARRLLARCEHYRQMSG